MKVRKIFGRCESCRGKFERTQIDTLGFRITFSHCLGEGMNHLLVLRGKRRFQPLPMRIRKS